MLKEQESKKSRYPWPREMMMMVVENEIEVKAQRFIFDPLVRNTKYGGIFSFFFSPYGNPDNAGEGDSSERKKRVREYGRKWGKMRNEQRGTWLI